MQLNLFTVSWNCTSFS